MADLDSVRALCTADMPVASFYLGLAQSGIALGASFQRVRRLHLGAQDALAELGGEAVGARSLADDAAQLDAALHAISPLISASAGDAACDDVLWLPVSYGDVSVPNARQIAASHVTIRAAESTSDVAVADVQLYDAVGLTAGVLRGVRVQRTDRAQVARLVGADTPLAFAMQWQLQPLTGSMGSLSGQHWAVLEMADDGETAYADAIVARGATVTRLSSSGFETQLHAAVQPGVALHGVIIATDASLAAATDSLPTDTIVRVAGTTLTLLRELAAHAVTPPHGVLIVTHGAAALDGDVTYGSIADAALWGLRHTTAAEHPELKLRIVDVPARSSELAMPLVLNECQAIDAEPRVAYRGSERFVARLGALRLPTPSARPLALLPPTQRLLESLLPTPLVRQQPASGMLEIAVHSAGLNFRDVLGALGMVGLPGNALGGECAGVVTAVGDNVSGVAIGDRVLAFALGALRTHVNVPADLVAPMPRWMSFEHASTLPVAYLTAWYALVHVAKVQRGDRVLIHAAAGGVGVAAVFVAQWLGATVVGTAGAPSKRAYLQSIGVSPVFDSRAVTFRSALIDADGRGSINVVLNALSDDFIPASLDVLAPDGRFVEIGKRGIWTPDAVAARRPDVAYSVFDLSTLPSHEASLRGGMLRDISALVERGELPPLPTMSFDLAHCVDAFRFMAQARHTGKIAITMPVQQDALRADGTYVVTGAFGALGRAVVERLVDRGARHLVLLARRAPVGDALVWRDALVARGIEVITELLDVSDSDAVRDALVRVRVAMPPLRGVVHTAGVNDDGALIAQTAARLAGVAGGKVGGAWNLDHLTRQDPIEFFVVFSSASGVLGWPGQSTYSSANTALDQVATLRHASGRSAISLQWGMWSGGGMVDRVAERARRFETAGMQTLAPTEALDLMMVLRSSPRVQLLLTRTDWSTFAAARPRDARLFDAVSQAAPARAVTSAAPVAAAVSLTAEVAALPESLRADAIRDAMMKLAARALGLPATARVDATRALRDLGLDSLMAVELRNAIGASVERTLPATLLFEYPSVDSLAGYVVSLLRPVAASAVSGPPTSPPARTIRIETALAPPADDVADLSDDEAEALLREELAASRTSAHRPSR